MGNYAWCDWLHNKTRLTMLVTAPWNLWRPAIVLHAFPAAVVSLLCVFTPVAVIFPPGGVTVEFREGVVRTPIPALATMNISDIGNGSTGSFVDKSLLRILNHHDLMTLAK